MGIPQQLYQRLPFKKQLDEMNGYNRLPPRLSFLQKRIRLKGSSTITVPLGVVLLFPVTVLLFIIFLFARHPHGSVAAITDFGIPPPKIRSISTKYDDVFVNGCVDPAKNIVKPRANAAIVVLARDSELEGLITSMRSFERHFNRWFHYPYVFLNDGVFSEAFKAQIRNYTESEITFGQLEPSQWGFPDWADLDVAKEQIAKQGDAAIMYGGMESYHHMCRFYSGFFFNHELLAKYKWYWRLEPDIKYFCDITYDPFLHMEQNNKTYGFTIVVKELKETVPNLFRYASAYKRTNNITSQGLWEMFAEDRTKKDEPKSDLPEDILKMDTKLPDVDLDAMEGEVYNMCHFWSNFEIARLDFWRSKAYQDFFEMLDKSGGFWSERWGDAPVHSLAAGVLLGPADIHYFRDFGYRHTTIQHCPANAPTRQLERPKWMEPQFANDPAKAKEEDDYFEHWDAEQENGVGCRCRCDTDITDIESKRGSCLSEWVKVAGGWTSPA